MSDLMQDFETGNLSHGLSVGVTRVGGGAKLDKSVELEADVVSSSATVAGAAYIPPPPPIPPASNLAEKAKVEVRADPVAASAAAAAELLKRLKAGDKGGAKTRKILAGSSDPRKLLSPVNEPKQSTVKEAGERSHPPSATSSGVGVGGKPAPIDWNNDEATPGAALDKNAQSLESSSDFDADWDQAPIPAAPTTLEPPPSEEWPENCFEEASSTIEALPNQDGQEMPQRSEGGISSEVGKAQSTLSAVPDPVSEADAQLSHSEHTAEEESSQSNASKDIPSVPAAAETGGGGASQESPSDTWDSVSFPTDVEEAPQKAPSTPSVEGQAPSASDFDFD